MKPIIPLYERILRLFFKEYYHNKDIKQKEHEDFIKKFPCKDCRPDGCTFYYDIQCYCNVCGRTYYI